MAKNINLNDPKPPIYRIRAWFERELYFCKYKTWTRIL